MNGDTLRWQPNHAHMMDAEEESLEWIEVPKEGDPWELPKGAEEGDTFTSRHSRKLMLSLLSRKNEMALSPTRFVLSMQEHGCDEETFDGRVFL